MDEESIEFLKSVWEAQNQEGYVFLACKHDNVWTDVPILLGADSIAEAFEGCEGDVYFCPNIFSEPRRKADYALPTVWLHADLDEVTPDEADTALNTTSAWQTSRGRYQCLWRLSKRVTPKAHRGLNRRLTYLTGADKGGWSITKVLRVPGTKNYKRKRPEPVVMMWHDQQHYLPRVVRDIVKDVKLREHLEVVRDLDLPKQTSRELRSKHRAALPARAKQLLLSKKAKVGERSDKLWELECLLVEAGVPADEALVMVRDTVWNKYAGTSRELSQLWAEVQKAVEHVGRVQGNAKQKSTTGSLDRGLTVVPYSRFMGKSVKVKTWAVEDVWSDSAHGFIAGEPKTFKSFIATDLAVAVASGSPFLGKFPVPEQGPVLMVQEENTVAMMKDRLEKIAAARGLMGGVDEDGELVMPTRLPIHLVNNCGLDLTDMDPDSKGGVYALRGLIEKIKPKLVVLDPLYMMIPGLNESSQQDLTPVLRELLMVKQEYGCGLIIVHHYNKPRDSEDRHPGNRLSGSGVLYRWFESVMYLEKLKTAGSVKMTTEHRSHAPGRPVHLQFDIGEMGELDYHVEVEINAGGGSGVETVRGQITELVRERGGVRGGVKAVEVAEELGLDSRYVLTVARRIGEKGGVKILEGKAEGSMGRPSKRLKWCGGVRET